MQGEARVVVRDAQGNSRSQGPQRGRRPGRTDASQNSGTRMASELVRPDGPLPSAITH